MCFSHKAAGPFSPFCLPISKVTTGSGSELLKNSSIVPLGKAVRSVENVLRMKEISSYSKQSIPFKHSGSKIRLHRFKF